ncbi:MAG: T9SS type A sorting domain-containing protein [Chitinispirillaceae bacterium]|nr:T9SS type A sorting domain-containing protein [Chitinispirillaceae bacterium]
MWIGLACRPGMAQVDPDIDARLERRRHLFQDADLPYRLFIPDDYSSAQEYPLILFLHGAVWRGNDNVTHLDNEFAVFWVQDEVQSVQPCFVLLPQCPANQTWEVVSGQVQDFSPAPMLEMVMDLLDSLLREFSIDTDRINCAGKSMGGQGVYGLISRYPDRFAACIPVAGPPVYRDAAEIGSIPLWILHAKDDPTVPISASQEMVRLLEQEGSPFIYTHCNAALADCEPIPPDSMNQIIAAGAAHIISIFDTATHQIEPKVVRTYGLAKWLLSQNKAQSDVTSATSIPKGVIGASYPNPFNSSTVLHYSLTQSVRVEADIYNVTGECIGELLSEKQDAGVHSLQWGGRDRAGNSLPTGMYFCLIQANQSFSVYKLFLIR